MLSTLSKNKKLSDPILEQIWKIKLLHCSICNINLLLEKSLLSTTHLSKYSHVSKKRGIEDSHCYENQSANDDFLIGSWTHFISSEEENSIVVMDKIPIVKILSIESVEVRILTSPNKVKWWDPVII